MHTPKQIAALKYLIAAARFTRDPRLELVKKIFWYLIDQSRGLSHDVCIILKEEEGYIPETIEAIGNLATSMNRSGYNVHLNEIMTAMNSELRFSVLSGCVGNPPASENDTSYTIWLSKQAYFKNAEILRVDRATLQGIDLGKPGLYPAMEQ